jgi:hypothetical protein
MSFLNCTPWGTFREKQSHALRRTVSKKCLIDSGFLQWTGAVSNRRHRPFQGRALPTELPVLIIEPHHLKSGGKSSAKPLS